MLKMFVVEGHNPYEEGDLLGVFSSREKACEKVRESKSHGNYAIREVEVDSMESPSMFYDLEY